jgi:hypothetical protein
MERLTKRTPKGVAYMAIADTLSKSEQEIEGSRPILEGLYSMFQKLADYEDTGFMPKEIQALSENIKLDAHKAPVPEGYTEIERTFCLDKFKQLGIELEFVTGVYIGKGEMIITGYPDEDNESHNCDEMGCSSVSHVLYRQNI